MAGLSAAWRLTDPDVRGLDDEVTVYQRGARLGGKGASHRGIHGRIEEHGLHVWLGYYDNAFRLMREVYELLNRPTTDPLCPIQIWSEAFVAAPTIGIEDLVEGEWSTWTAIFPENARVPGEPIGDWDRKTTSDFVAQATRLMTAFVASTNATVVDAGAAGVSVLARHFGDLASGLETALPFLAPLRISAEATADVLGSATDKSPAGRRTHQLLDLVVTQLRGMQRDDLARRGIRSINDESYRDWLARHGASRATLDGPLLRGLHDLAFSHRNGDRRHAEFPAGLGLFLATKTFFEYDGALFFKMTAGMGDVIMAPLYQALKERGVRFEFFSAIDSLHVEDGALETVHGTRQIQLADGVAEYQPLQRFGGLPCFPEFVHRDQLADPRLVDCQELETVWSDTGEHTKFLLQRGADFDDVVFAIPPGMGRSVCAELAAADERWKVMFDGIETVPTQAFQLWMTESEESLGWHHSDSTVTGYVDSYDTWSSMTHLLEHETWDRPDPPQTIAYFCSTMSWDEEVDPTDAAQPLRAHRAAQTAAASYIEEDLTHYLPGSAGDDGRFRWDLLIDHQHSADQSPLDSQYVRANIDPSDQYVQSLPGTDHIRLAPGDSGFEGLHLAGDWTDCGLNAGCIESAVISGIGAANSVLGLDRGSRISGGYPIG